MAHTEGNEVDYADPENLVDPLRRSARLQAVKCSPLDGRRSTLPAAMRAHCPPLLLADEIDVLRPGALLTLGEIPWRAVQDLDRYEETDWGEQISVGTLTREWGTMCVYGFPHPAATGQWDYGQEQLARHLGEGQLER